MYGQSGGQPLARSRAGWKVFPKVEQSMPLIKAGPDSSVLRVVPETRWHRSVPTVLD
jgi:hypothetical protein